MKSFLGGAALGLILGAAAMYSLTYEDTESSATTAETIETSKAQSPQLSRSANSQSRDVGIVSTPSPAHAHQTDSSASIGLATDAPQRAEPGQQRPSTPNSPASPTESPSDNSRDVVTDAIPLHDALRETLAKQPDGHRSLQLHSALERELRDDSWSHYMEQTLGNYLGVRAPQVGVEIINVACRSTACEIQAFDAGEMSPGIARLMSAATKEPWWEFTSMDARSATHESRGVAIIFLSRAQKSEQRPLKRNS